MVGKALRLDELHNFDAFLLFNAVDVKDIT